MFCIPLPLVGAFCAPWLFWIVWLVVAVIGLLLGRFIHSKNCLVPLGALAYLFLCSGVTWLLSLLPGVDPFGGVFGCLLFSPVILGIALLVLAFR